MIRKSTLAIIASGALLAHLVSAPSYALNDQPLSPPGITLAQAQQAAPAPQAPPTPQQRAEQIKQWMQFSQQNMRAYEWIETTIVSVKGEEKSRSQKRCYYGADGNLQKVVLQASPEKSGGMPGILPLGKLVNKAKKNKKEEMTDYMRSAAELVHSYIPPAPGLIQQSINAGKLGMQMPEPNRRVRVTFGDYLKPGDSLSFDIELPSNRLLAVAVSSYLSGTNDPIALNVTMSILPDGTIYAAHSQLDAKAKGINVIVENTGHRRIAS